MRNPQENKDFILREIDEFSIDHNGNFYKANPGPCYIEEEFIADYEEVRQELVNRIIQKASLWFYQSENLFFLSTSNVRQKIVYLSGLNFNQGRNILSAIQSSRRQANNSLPAYQTREERERQRVIQREREINLLDQPPAYETEAERERQRQARREIEVVDEQIQRDRERQQRVIERERQRGIIELERERQRGRQQIEEQIEIQARGRRRIQTEGERERERQQRERLIERERERIELEREISFVESLSVLARPRRGTEANQEREIAKTIEEINSIRLKEEEKYKRGIIEKIERLISFYPFLEKNKKKLEKMSEEDLLKLKELYSEKILVKEQIDNMYGICPVSEEELERKINPKLLFPSWPKKTPNWYNIISCFDNAEELRLYKKKVENELSEIVRDYEEEVKQAKEKANKNTKQKENSEEKYIQKSSNDLIKPIAIFSIIICSLLSFLVIIKIGKKSLNK